MSCFNQYWTLIKLTGSGKGTPQKLPKVKAIIQNLHSNATETDKVPNNRQLQRQLFEQANQDFNSLAMLALRCYISHQTLAICHDFVTKFGDKYALKTEEILPILLDDEGKLPQGTYKPQSHKILTTFNPERASLSTWSSRLINSNSEFNQYLEQQGLRRITDWAMLNSVKPNKIKRLQKNAPNLDQTLALLQAYQTVYTHDRLLQGKRGKRCEDPTPNQCQAMSELMVQQGFTTTAESILANLKALAQLIRTEVAPPSISLDIPDQRDHYENLSLTTDDPELQEFSPADFLEHSKAELSACLPQIAKDIIQQHHQRLKPKKAVLYPRAMTLFYCQGRTMTEIATDIGMNDQTSVTRLLKLKQLRADIRHGVITHIKPKLSQLVTPHLSPTQLQDLDKNLDHYLGETLDGLIRSEKDQAQMPRQYAESQKRSVLAQVISQILQQLYPIP